LHSQVSHINGRIEKLYVNFTGETVRQGQVIASVYSPDLLNAQQELLEAAKLQSSQPALLAAAREKLRLWKLTGSQIAAIEQAGTASPLVEIVAATGGIVTAKKVEQGDYVNPGTVLYDLTDLSSVWAVFDAYEMDLPYLKIGDGVQYTLQALPGKTCSGKISFIDPVLDKATRTAKIRVETANPGLQLKPEMYADAVVKASPRQQADEIVIPKTAVLWTGKRSIVYLKQPDSDVPVFKLREIELGASLGDACVVLSGIDEGDEIVTGGAFTIDAGAQLEGKRSMMNPPGQ
jgi:Cu(I)/Ag(I) efflux system membrane fusion protein